MFGRAPGRVEQSGPQSVSSGCLYVTWPRFPVAIHAPKPDYAVIAEACSHGAPHGKILVVGVR